MREGLIRVSISTIGIKRGVGAAVCRIEGADGDRELGERRCAMQDGSRRHQIDDRRRQLAFKVIDIDRGIEQERYPGGNLQWIKRKIRLWPMRQRSRPATGIMAGDDRLNIRFQAQNPLAGVQLGLRTKVQNHQVRQAPQARR